MNKFISVIKNLCLHKILMMLVVALSVLLMQAFGNTAQAFADETVKSPYGYYYKGTPDENISTQNRNILNQDRNAFNQDRNANRYNNQQLERTERYSQGSFNKSGETVKSPYGYYYKGTPDENVSNQVVDSAKRNLKDTAGNVREKLNLDEPVPEATKDFIQSAKQKVGEAVESLTGSQQNQQDYSRRQEYQDPRYYQKPLDK
ncbi:hypothetical protein QUB80_21455 [Chlorogloeopsis sp. ULAP01]|uniref:hypothetical protein n=1 Tax=Chlorogloeopsis sp. ULAP01 TaxID=3056483 RepID=UPI0025AB1C81|nr:hypothetical protein [Chlorogloeopsis sp. ULAP01]MDM9383261.1 hypothetical protein [Chlorogloeopsis sp. ULAP01]